jgi:hypothetical protein
MNIKTIEAELRKLYPSGHPDFIPMCLEEIKLHSEKNADYAKYGNPLGNFKRVSGMLWLCGMPETPPEVVALIYMLKQIDAVMNMLIKDYEGEIEGIDAKLKDIAVYAKLISILRKG